MQIMQRTNRTLEITCREEAKRTKRKGREDEETRTNANTSRKHSDARAHEDVGAGCRSKSITTRVIDEPMLAGPHTARVS